MRVQGRCATGQVAVRCLRPRQRSGFPVQGAKQGRVLADPDLLDPDPVDLLDLNRSPTWNWVKHGLNIKPTGIMTHRIHVWYIYTNIGGVLMVNVTIFSIHGSYG